MKKQKISDQRNSSDDNIIPLPFEKAVKALPVPPKEKKSIRKKASK